MDGREVGGGVMVWLVLIFTQSVYDSGREVDGFGLYFILSILVRAGRH